MERSAIKTIGRKPLERHKIKIPISREERSLRSLSLGDKRIARLKAIFTFFMRRRKNLRLAQKYQLRLNLFWLL